MAVVVSAQQSENILLFTKICYVWVAADEWVCYRHQTSVCRVCSGVLQRLEMARQPLLDTELSDCDSAGLDDTFTCSRVITYKWGLSQASWWSQKVTLLTFADLNSSNFSCFAKTCVPTIACAANHAGHMVLHVLVPAVMTAAVCSTAVNISLHMIQQYAVSRVWVSELRAWSTKSVDTKIFLCSV